MRYELHGITVETPFQCPELPVSQREADVTVRWGAARGASRAWREVRVCYKATPDAYLLSITGVADFLVEGGGTVTIEKAANVEEDRLRLHFYHEVMAALLWQRGNLLLKGCVLERAGRGIALVGPTPSGKTMTAARLLQRGFRVVSDGFCCIAGDAAPIAQPGYPYLMLWEKSLEKLGLSPEDLKPVRRGMQRFYLPVGQSFHNDPVKLEAIHVHSFCAEAGLSITKISGANKLSALVNNYYHPELVAPLGVAEAAARIAWVLAQQAEVKVLRYNDMLVPVDEYVERLEKELENTAK